MARPREFDEEQVLGAARAAFLRGGYRGTSLADLTAATGLGKGSLYGAFGDKHQLFQRVFEDFCSDVCAEVTHALDGPDETALQRLTAYAARTARESGACADPATGGCMLARTTAELGGRDEAITARANEAFASLQTHLREAIEGAQRVGDLDPSADADLHAIHLLSTLRGIESLGKAGMPAPRLTEIAGAALDALPRA